MTSSSGFVGFGDVQQMARPSFGLMSLGGRHVTRFRLVPPRCPPVVVDDTVSSAGNDSSRCNVFQLSTAVSSVLVLFLSTRLIGFFFSFFIHLGLFFPLIFSIHRPFYLFSTFFFKFASQMRLFSEGWRRRRRSGIADASSITSMEASRRPTSAIDDVISV